MLPSFMTSGSLSSLLFGGGPGASTASRPLDHANTFRPRRQHRAGSKRYELHKRAQDTLGQGNLHESVTLPEGEDVNEWLATLTIDFYNDVNLLFGVISECCTEAGCPVMNAGPKYEYQWADGIKIVRPVCVSAPKYVDFLMAWVQSQLDDEKLFPTRSGTPFPPDFRFRVQQIFKRLFRVYAHIYYCHFEYMVTMGAEPHLNTCFKHFMYFVFEFDLIPNPREREPLQELIDKLFHRDVAKYGPSTPLQRREGSAAGSAASSASAQALALPSAPATPTSTTPPPLPTGLDASGLDAVKMRVLGQGGRG